MEHAKSIGRSVGRKILTWKGLSSLISLMVIVISFRWLAGPSLFAKSLIRGSLLDLGVDWCFMAMPVAILMIAGEFDLSVGSVYAFGGCGLFKLFQMGLGPWEGFIIVILACIVIGMIHGVITIRLGIPSFVTTLGGMWIWRSVTRAMWEYTPTAPEAPVEYFDNILGMPMLNNWFYSKFVLMVAVFIVLWIILERTSLGNSIFAAGGDYESALARGARPDRTKFIMFILTAAFAGFAGMVTATTTGGAATRMGMGYELMMIAAAVIGGCSLRGGIGSVEGALIGVFLLRFINSGVILIGVGPAWFLGIVGLAMLLAVVLNRNFRRRVVRKLR